MKIDEIKYDIDAISLITGTLKEYKVNCKATFAPKIYLTKSKLRLPHEALYTLLCPILHVFSNTSDWFLGGLFSKTKLKAIQNQVK